MINFEAPCQFCGKFVQNHKVYQCPVCGQISCENCCPGVECPRCHENVVTWRCQIGWQYRE